MRVSAAIGLMLLAIGCSNKLETGYEPRRLGASSTERRSYYASPYTPESNAAALDRDTEFEARRPKPGY